MKAFTFSIVVPVLNSMATLPQCLDALATAIGTCDCADLIVVDNGSTDGSYEFAMSHAVQARVASLPRVTISALRNCGARMASGEYLSFIDSDCVVPPDYFQTAARVFERFHPDAAGCNYHLPAAPTWVEETWHHLHWQDRDDYVSYIPAGNLLIRREVFERIGGFNEQLATGEDAELGIRLNSRGGKIYRAREIRAVHLGNAKTLAAFSRKQLWHSQGMFGSMAIAWMDRVVIMTFVHVPLVLAAVAVLLAPVPFWLRLAAALTSASVVPGLSVAYRFRRRRAIYRPLRSLLLYHVYFGCRTQAIFRIGTGRTAVSGREAPAAPARGSTEAEER